MAIQTLLAYKSHQEGATDPYTSLLPIGLCYLHSLLIRHDYSSLLANFSLDSWKEVEAFLVLQRPRIVGISQFTHNRFESYKLARLAKRIIPECLVVFGGPHATHQYAELLSLHDDIDAVVVGEGEATFLELVNAVSSGRSLCGIPGLAVRDQGKVAFASRETPVSDLDALPSPATAISSSHHVDLIRQLEFVVTSRGCPAACRFCSSPQFWHRRLAFRSPRAIVDEIKFIRDRYGLLYFSFRDDTFTADKQRIMELCRILLEERIYILWNCQSRVNAIDGEMLAWMKRAGCECVQFGVESGSRNILRTLGKQISPDQVVAASRAVREVGMNLSVYLIAGVPGETEDDVAATLGLMEKIKPHDGQVSPLAYYPGTVLFQEAAASGALPAAYFEETKGAALTVRPEAIGAASLRLLLRGLESVGKKASYSTQDFAAQKKRLGYCFATNLLSGDSLREKGNLAAAEQEYREIVDRQHDNPWGWMALGELHGEAGNVRESSRCYERVLHLVPHHVPALAARGELALMAGNAGGAARYFREAVKRDPFNVVAREGLAHLGVK